jgi:hypothetical protein
MTTIDISDRTRRAAAARQSLKRWRRARGFDAVVPVAFNMDAVRRALLHAGSLTPEEGLSDRKVKTAIGMLVEDMILDWVERVTS